VSASVGVATLSTIEEPCTSPNTAAAGADVLLGLTGSGVALRAAKAAGRNRVELYDGPVAAAHRRDLLVERRLRAAIDAGTVVPHYQPIVNLGTRLVVGVEALARWDDDVLGRVTPDEFIPVAERSNQIVALGACVLRQAIHDLAQPVTSDGSCLRVGVNASVVQLRRPGFADAVLEHLQQSGFDPNCLIIEVTESLFVDVDDPAVRELHALRAGGVHVAIDDFGSGYSSLAYLARMPADVLKIDRGLTAQVLYDERSRVVLQSIVSLANSLPMDVVVEGVESAAVHDLVRDLGGEYGQGWLYGAAVPFARLAEAIADINARALLPLLLPIPHQTR
jgi:EAL domain-containing protein (putative c-di-GMP-specific phosphodiesterase class I)